MKSEKIWFFGSLIEEDIGYENEIMKGYIMVGFILKKKFFIDFSGIWIY